jgi:hypothetical protein
MTIRERIIDQLGVNAHDAHAIELAARLLNRREELRTIEDLTAAEFAALVVRANAVHLGLSARIQDFLEGDRS